MSLLATILFAASALIILWFGGAHLVFTFFGAELAPRDPALLESMRHASLVITDENSMWNAWLGFNASHALGAMLFGAIYGYLAIFHRDFLRRSPFLQALGLLTWFAYLYLAHRYWFSAPFYGILLATVLYVAALVAARR